MALKLGRRHTQFQHTAARRRLQNGTKAWAEAYAVSTHSRAEAAAASQITNINKWVVSTHSRAEAAALQSQSPCYRPLVSTHSRAEAAAS